MRISELDNKAFLANDGVGDNSYVVITYAEDANDSPVSFKATLNELGRLIVSNMKLAQYDTQNDKKDLGTLVGVSKLKPTPAPEPSEGEGGNEEPVIEEPETEPEPITREVYNAVRLGQFITDADRTTLDNLGTASTKDVPTSGNATTTQVVMGNDTRLTDARNAADVSAWAKESTKPSYTAAEVHALPDTIVNVSSFTNDAGYLTSHQDISGKANSSDLAAVATSGDYEDLINTPTINTTNPVFTTSITIGNTELTEAQLQALLELLNSGE